MIVLRVAFTAALSRPALPTHHPSCVRHPIVVAASPELRPTGPNVDAAAAEIGPLLEAPDGGKLQLGWQTHAAGTVCACSLAHLRLARAPALVAAHVGLMSLMLPLGTAALSNVRQVKAKPSDAKRPPDAAGRKARAERLIIRHFATSALALYAGVVGLAAIVCAGTAARGAAHLGSAHGRFGALALALWGATYLSAQPHVWRDQLKARRFSLFTNKRWLWADATHRKLGTLAFGASLGAYGSGLLGWGGIGARWALPCCGVLCAIGGTTLGRYRRPGATTAAATRPRGGALRLGRARPPAMMADGSGGPKQQTTGPNVDAAAAEIGPLLEAQDDGGLPFDGQDLGALAVLGLTSWAAWATPGPPLLFALRTAGVAVAAPATVAIFGAAHHVVAYGLGAGLALVAPSRLGVAYGVGLCARQWAREAAVDGYTKRARAAGFDAFERYKEGAPVKCPWTRTVARLPLTVGTAAVVAAYAIPLRLAAAALPAAGAPWRAALRLAGVGVAAACVGAQALGSVCEVAMPRIAFFTQLPDFVFHLAIVAAAAAGAASLGEVWLALLAPAVVVLAPGPWRAL